MKPVVSNTITINWFDIKDLDKTVSKRYLVSAGEDFETWVDCVYWYAPEQKFIHGDKDYPSDFVIDYFADVDINDLFIY
jgi:hypothetical protein